MMAKKGQGLSLNTIIIAIIVLVVLVVIIMVFSGAFGTTIIPGINDCDKKPAQKCFTESCGSAGTGTYKAPGLGKCKEASQKCCLDLGSSA